MNMVSTAEQPRPLHKLLGKTRARPSRFHSLQGQSLPLGRWLDVPKALYARVVTRKQPEGPWMSPAAIEHLSTTIQKDWRVFEYGSGSSTEWFALRSEQVVSVEDNPAWHAKVLGSMQAMGRDNVTLILKTDQKDYFEAIATYPDGAFDLVIVDGLERSGTDRMHCVEVARNKVKKGGWLLLDDADRPAYRVVDEILQGWQRTSFVGFKSNPLTTVDTALFRRPNA